MSDRVMVFIDYQNTYRAARDAFCWPSSAYWEGQFWPHLMGRRLVAGSRFDRELVGVRVYRGMPSSRFDPKAYGAARAQMAAWQAHEPTTPVFRPLRYPHAWPEAKAEEKGIDVALAVDFVMCAVKGAYDVGVIVSLDTDLKPALEVVRTQLHGVRVEVAAWSVAGMQSRRLGISGGKIWCHWMDEAFFEAVRDDTDYTRSRA